MTDCLSAVSWDDGDNGAAAAAAAATVAEAAIAAMPRIAAAEGSKSFLLGDEEQKDKETHGAAVAPPCSCTDTPCSLSFSQLRAVLAAEEGLSPSDALPPVAEGPKGPSTGAPKKWERLWETSCDAILKILFCINGQLQQQEKQSFVVLRFSLLPDAKGKMWVTKVSPFCLGGGVGPQGAPQGGPLVGGPQGQEDFRGLVALVRDVINLVDPPGFDRQKLIKVRYVPLE